VFIGHGKSWGTTPYNTIFPEAIAEPGDDIYISRLDTAINKPIYNKEIPDDFKVIITGQGAKKYICYIDVLKKRKELIDKNVELYTSGKQPVFPKATDTIKVLDYIKYRYSDVDKKFEDSLVKIVDHYKSKLSPAAFFLLKADIIGTYELDFATSFIGEINKYKESPAFLEKLLGFYFERIKASPFKPVDTRLANSAQYIAYLTSQTSIKKYLLKNFNDNSFIESVINQYKGIMRDRILAYYVVTRHIDLGNDTAIKLSQIKNSLEDAFSIDCFENVIAGSVKGSTAFNFKLEDADGKFISLSDFNGKIVLLDFWYTGCIHCAEYYHDVLSKIEEEYKNDKTVRFITINIDRSKEMWKRSIKKGTNLGLYTSENAINLYANSRDINSSVTNKYNVAEYPHPFLIDPGGKIASTDQRVLRDYDSLKSAIESLKNQH